MAHVVRIKREEPPPSRNSASQTWSSRVQDNDAEANHDQDDEYIYASEKNSTPPRYAYMCIDGTAQGAPTRGSPSFVIVDTVQTYRAGFVEDARRLNVSLTRAKFCEVLLLNRNILPESKKDRRPKDTNVDIRFLVDLFNYHKSHGLVFELDDCGGFSQTYTPLNPAKSHICRFDVVS